MVWTHPSGDVRLIERELPDAWAGHQLDRLLVGEDGYRLVFVTRAGQSTLASPGLWGQEGDLLHVVVTAAGADALKATVLGGPTS